MRDNISSLTRFDPTIRKVRPTSDTGYGAVMGEPKEPVDYDPRMDAAAAPDLNPPKKGWGCLGYCLGGCGAIIGLSLIIGFATTSNSKPYDSNNQYEAIAQCEDLVTARLKSPTSAEFDSSASSNGDRQWTVTGTVDADNSFGAKIRNTYQCSVRMIGDGKVERRLDRLG
ncbi:hypothetical protein [Microbacterium enclense]|uniref:hypothetical protein n=1 Tax=Microbacterium enclense TaxID=993073 RepID=UPI00343EC158